MHKKQKLSAFDIAAFIVFLTLAFIVWAFLQVFSLVKPVEFELETASAASGLTAEAESERAVGSQRMAAEELRARLSAVLDRFATSQPNEFGIFVKHLDSGVSAEHNGQTSMVMASLYKPFVAVEALKLVDDGLLSLSQPLLADGTTLEECLEKTITVSDNPCGRALLRATNFASDYGLQKLRTLGYKHTDLRSYLPKTAPSDVAKLLESIYRGSGLSADAQYVILSALLGQQIDDRLARGVPDSVRIAHKTGDLEGYAHDAGLVLGQESGDYILVVMSGPDSSGRMLNQRYADFGRLASDIHKVMVDYVSSAGD